MLKKVNNVHLIGILIILAVITFWVKMIDRGYEQPNYINENIHLDPTVYRLTVEEGSGRNTTIIHDDASDNWERIKFMYPSNASYEMRRQGDGWYIADRILDTLILNPYLKGLAWSDGTVFLENVRAYTLTIPTYSLTVYKSTGDTISVSCFVKDDTYILRSTMNNENLFDAQADGLFNIIYAGKPRFFGSEK